MDTIDFNKAIKEAITDALEKAANSPTNSLNQSDVVKTATVVNAEVKPVVQHITNNEPWYQSRVTWGSIISIVVAGAGFVGVQTEVIQQDKLIEGMIALGPIIGGGISLWGRWVARKPIGT